MTDSPSLEHQLDLQIQSFSQCLQQELSQAFQRLKEEYADPAYGIYAIGLYYDQGSWQHLAPLLASKKALDWQANQDQDSPLSIADRITSRRWGLIDNPHAQTVMDQDWLPESLTVLEHIQALLEEAEEEIEATEPEHRFHQALIEDLIKDSYLQLRLAARRALLNLKDEPWFQEWLAETGAILVTDATPYDDAVQIEDIHALNDEAGYRRFYEGRQAMTAMCAKEAALIKDMPDHWVNQAVREPEAD